MEQELTPVEIAKQISKRKLRHATYETTVAYAKDMEPHAFATSESKLLTEYRPLEDATIRAYRLQIWQAVSHAEFNRAMTVVSRIFSEGLHSIEYPEPGTQLITEKELPKRFFEREFSESGSLMTFAKDTLLRFVLGDPNGVLSLRRTAGRDDELWNVHADLWPSNRVVGKSHDGIIVEAWEKSKLSTDKTTPTGKVYIFFLADRTITVKQVGDAKNHTFEEVATDPHEYGKPMAVVVGGSAWKLGKDTYFKSFFDGAVPHWNKLLREDSDLDGSVVRNLYPQRVYMDVPCSACNGVGKITDGDNVRTQCGTCKGAGRLVGGSPYKDIILNRAALDRGLKPSDAVSLVQEDITFYDHMAERLNKHRVAGLEALSLQAIMGVLMAQSGVAKKIDRQDVNMFLGGIANRMYFLIEWTFAAATHLRYSTMVPNLVEDMVPVVMRPLHFDAATLDMLVEESKVARQAGLHPSIVARLDKAIARKEFGKESNDSRIVAAMIDLDPYYGMDPDKLLTINSLSPGSVNALDLKISANIRNLMQSAMEQNPDFLDLPKSRQREILEQLAQPEEAAQDEPSGLEDLDASAKAKIRGSVGGVQGIIDINRAVSEAVMSESSAEQILVSIYGIDLETARRLIEPGGGNVIEPTPAPAPVIPPNE